MEHLCPTSMFLIKKKAGLLKECITSLYDLMLV